MRSLGERLRLDKWSHIATTIARIGPVYERMNKLMSLLLGPLARIRGVWAAGRLCGGGGVVVDVGSGHGVSAELLSRMLRPRYMVLVEPCREMAYELRMLAQSLLGDIVIAVGEALPFRTGCCKLVSAFYSLRDFMSPWKGVAEMLRVARNCMLIVDLFLPKSRVAAQFLSMWVCRIVPLIAMLFARRFWLQYRELCRTLEGWVPGEAIARALSKHTITAFWETGLGSLAIILAARGVE